MIFCLDKKAGLGMGMHKSAMGRTAIFAKAMCRSVDWERSRDEDLWTGSALQIVRLAQTKQSLPR